MSAYHCKRCGESIQGDAELCVSCFRDLTVPCSACTWRNASGKVKVNVDDRKAMVNCPACANERYVIRDYLPGEKKKGG